MLEIDRNEIKEGEMYEFKDGKTSVLVLRVEDQVYAVGNKCTHLGCKLSDGQLEGHVVTCPCHGTKYDVTNGEVIEHVGNWPKVMQKAASLIMRNEPVFEVSTQGEKLIVKTNG